MSVATVSRRQLDRAGERLRDWWRTPDLAFPDDPVEQREFFDAYGIVREFRNAFQEPLKRVTVGVRQFVSRESTRVLVAQRLKRMPTIYDKLDRLPNMRLSRMQDIGGCRAILPGGAPEMSGVLRRIRRNWDVSRVYDYVAEPKPSGYRSVHVVVLRMGKLIEIQLRSPGQHEWAVQVERAFSRTGFNVKDGHGPPELLRYFERAAYGIALSEQGQPVDEAFEREFAALRDYVRPLFTRG